MFVLVSNARSLGTSQPSMGQVAITFLLAATTAIEVRLFQVDEDSAVLVVCKELRVGDSVRWWSTFLLGSACDINTVRVGIGGHIFPPSNSFERPLFHDFKLVARAIGVGCLRR